MTDIKLKQTDIKNFTKYLDDLINIGNSNTILLSEK